MPNAPQSREGLVARFQKYSDQKQFQKAIDTAFGGGVKDHVFLPSGRRIFTVVGRNAEEFIDPEKSYCTCESYFYGVLGKRTKQCYHLLSYRIAEESDLVKEVRFDDEEYEAFMKLLASDVLRLRELGRSRSHGRD